MFVLPRPGSGVAPDESVRPARPRPYRSGAGRGDRFGGRRPADAERSRGPAAVRDRGAGRRPERTVLAVTSTGREAEDLVDRAALPAAGRAGRALPGLGDAAARAALAARRHRRPAAGRAAPAGPPVGTTTRATGPLSVVVAPVRSVLQPQVPGLGELDAGRAARRRRRPRADRHRHRPGRRRLRPRRAGREARRLRGARRHPRRLPADRGAPAAGRVLGRRGRGDPLLQGRRPALARGAPSTGCGRRRAASCC